SARHGRKLVLQFRKSHVISRQCSHNRRCEARSVTLNGTRRRIRSSNLDSVRKSRNRDPSHVRRIRTRVVPESPITIYTTHDDNWLISATISLRRPLREGNWSAIYKTRPSVIASSQNEDDACFIHERQEKLLESIHQRQCCWA